MKADLAIYNDIVDTSGRYMSLSLILGFKWISVLDLFGTFLINPFTYTYVANYILLQICK